MGNQTRLIGMKAFQERLGGVSRTTAYELMRARKVKSCQIGSRRMFDEESVNQYIAALLESDR